MIRFLVILVVILALVVGCLVLSSRFTLEVSIKPRPPVVERVALNASSYNTWAPSKD